MKLLREIKLIREAIGTVNHHANCSSRIGMKIKCDCYAKDRQLLHEALDRIVLALKAEGVRHG